MRKLTRGSLAAILAYGVALAVILPVLGTATAGAATAAATAKVVVLPLANNTKVGGTELADRVQRALQLNLAASNRATIMNLRPTSPAVRRAIDIDKTLEPSDLELKPPVTRAQAEKLGQAVGADLVLWGSIEEYNSDQRTKQVTIGLSIQKLDLRADQVSTVAVTGKSAEKVGFEGGEGALVNEAVDDAVGQVVQQTLGVTVAPVTAQKTPAPTVAKKKNRTWQWVGLALAGVAVAVLAGGGGGDGAPAVLPGVVTSAIATPTADSVDLSWDTAATNVTSFNIFRADMGQVSRMSRVPRSAHSRVRLTRQTGGYSLLANVGRADRAYRDVSTTIGSLYAYEIAAVVGSAESAQVPFYNQYAPGVIEVGPDYPTPPAKPTCTNGLQSVNVRWTRNPEPFIDSYRVLRAASASGPWALRGTVPPGMAQPTFDDTGVVVGTTYFYAIAAVTEATGANGRMGLATEIAFEPGKPMPPSNVVAQPRIGGVELTWTASPDTSVTAYRIFRATAPAVQLVQIDQVAGTVTTYLDSPLAAGSYTYAVAAVVGLAVSDLKQATPAPVSPSAAPSSVNVAQPPPVVANGTSTVDIIATVRDSAQKPVQGVPVVFSLSGGGGTLVAHPSYPATTVPAGLSVLTDATGKAGVRFKAGTNPEAVPVVTAVCTGAGGSTLSDNVTVTLEARQAAGLTLVAESSVVPGDGTSSTVLTATVVDQGGGGLQGVTVQFASLATNIGTVAPASDVTDADGQATTTLTSAAPGRYGSCTVRATAVGAPAGVQPAEVTVEFAAAPRVTVSIEPPVIPAAGLGSTALITATVKYAGGQPVSDGTIMRFGFEGGVATSATGARIADGRQRMLTEGGLAYSTLISAPDLANGDSDVIWVWMDLNDNGKWDGASETLGSAVVTYTDPPFRVTVAADPSSLPAGGGNVSKIVADVRTNVPDPSGGGFKPVADGTQVDFVSSAGTFVDSDTSQTAGRTIGGLVTVYLKASAQAAVATVTATAALISGSTQVTFTTPAKIEVTVMADPASLQANGADTSEITARVRDAATGNPQIGANVDFATDLGTLSEISATTDDGGNATVTFTAGTTAGTATVVAKSGGVTGFQTLTLTSGQPQNISLTMLAPSGVMPATNGMTSPSGASSTALVSARVTDKFGNPVIDGTPVFFHTDIGQIEGSIPTANGLAEALLTTGSFLEATNKATFRPGWASVTSYANNPAGPATAGPLHPIFCGNVSAFTWDGAANDTDVYTPWGADWRTDQIGGEPPSAFEPFLSPRAGDEITPVAILADENNNPLPSGIPIVWEFRVEGSIFATVTDTTGLVVSPSGVMRCVSSNASATVTKFPSDTTETFVTITANVPSIIDAQMSPTIGQWVGAAGPSGTIEVVSPDGTNVPPGTYTIQATVRDEFGNKVQNGTSVYFAIQDPTNVDVTFSPMPAPTTGGTATTFMTVTLIDPATQGSFALLVGSPQPPPNSDASGSINFTIPATVVP